ncbi:amino acid permease [Streptomyces boninensis]|uniref:amino acid permease n=1 Tax=Streptomyces boninensis TaxID=2039455 RepID=UPI003B21EE93
MQTTAPPDSKAPALPHRLKQRHLTMLALGGALGSGLFLGSGAALQAAGPAIILSYLLAGALVLLVMRMMGEMSAAYPSSGSFSTHAERALGRWAGFTVGWLYWILLVVVLAIEATGAASLVRGWFPDAPQWALVLLFVVVFTAVNLRGVRFFGESEFWFAAIKVAAVVGFLILGVLAICGAFSDVDGGLSNLTKNGGFAPKGWDGISAGLLMVIFSFGGLEAATIAAGEAEDPQRSIAKAVRSAVLRILLFYVGSMIVIAAVLPWDKVDPAASPYATVLDMIGIPGTGRLIEVIAVVALLSALNANIYGASRMIYSLADRGQAPKALLKVSGDGVPRTAVLASVAFCYVAVLLNVYWPDTIFKFLANAVGALLLVVWFMVAVSQLRLRRMLERDDPARLAVKMWGFPYLTWIAMAGMVALTALMLTDSANRNNLMCAGIVTLAVAVASVIVDKRRHQAA